MRLGWHDVSPNPNPDAAVSLRGVVKKYGDTTAVDHLDLEVPRAGVLALLGPNGAGKTTTVEMCEGFLRPDAGEVRVLGLDPATQGEQVRRRIGVMLQGGGAYPGARVDEMLNLVASYSRNPHDPEWLLDVLGLTPHRRTPYRRLSGGQQQRLSLALALVGRPELVFLDEPTAGLDAQSRHLVWDLVESLRRDGVTVVLTTHFMEEVERLADHVVVIDHGRVVARGTPTELTGAERESRIRVRTLDRLDLPALIGALPSGTTCREVAGSAYEIDGAISPSLLTAIAGECERQGIQATEIRVASRSLEEVFLDLTGRELRR